MIRTDPTIMPKLAAKRERLLFTGAEAFSLRRKGISVAGIAIKLGRNEAYVYRALRAVEATNAK